MPTYTKETALYDTGAIAGDIHNASQTADAFITAIDQNGIKVHAVNNKNTNYTVINPSGMEVFSDGTSVAEFGQSTRIGTELDTHIELSPKSMGLVNSEISSLNIGLLDSERQVTIWKPLSDETGYENLTILTVQQNDTAQKTVQLPGTESVTIDSNATGLSAMVLITPSVGRSILLRIIVAGTETTDSIFVSDYFVVTYTVNNHTITVERRNSSTMGYTVSLIRYEQSYNVYSPDVVFNYGLYNTGETLYGAGPYSSSFGYMVKSPGEYSHAEGNDATSSGIASHAEGYRVTASGSYSHAEGNHTTASGDYSHAEGDYTTASGDYSHAEGDYTTASGDYSHAGGNNSEALGNNSFAHGESVSASANQFVIGKFNETSDTTSPFVIGGGTSNNNPRNLFTIASDGSAYHVAPIYLFNSDLHTTGTPNAYVEQSIRFGSSEDSLTEPVGEIRTAKDTSGNNWVDLEVSRKIGGTVYKNRIRTNVDSSGEATYSISNPTNFRSALGLSGLGSVVTKDQSANVSIASATWSGITSISLSAGTWIVTGGAHFSNNSTGYRYLVITTSSSSPSTAERRTSCASSPAFSNNLNLNTFRIMVLSSTTTVRLSCYQNSGSAMNVVGSINAVRII